MDYTDKKLKKVTQYFVSILSVTFVSLTGFILSDTIGYKTVALILLFTVSLLAVLFDIFPVLTAALLSALILNFFFIPPLFTFHIDSTEDLLLFLMYFIIASINAALTIKIRNTEQRAREKEEREKTIRLYNTLLNSLSHEIRTPLSTMLGAIDTLKENHSQLSEVNRAKLFSEVEIAGGRLNRQVENLLNMSRLETGILQLKKDWSDMNELVFSVIEKFSDDERSHKISFEANERLPLFKLDSGLVENVLHNIIHNAIQYTPEQTKILIEASFANDVCKISIADSGSGFPKSEIDKVFDKFYRLPQTKTGGTGLGLSIAKGFIESHGGEISLENRKEGGAKFTISIPCPISFVNNISNE